MKNNIGTLTITGDSLFIIVDVSRISHVIAYKISYNSWNIVIHMMDTKEVIDMFDVSSDNTDEIIRNIQQSKSIENA